MIPVYQQVLLPEKSKWVNGDGSPTRRFFDVIRSLHNRGGANTGVGRTVGADLMAAGTGQDSALELTDDFNEVLQGSGGVRLASLQPGQWHIVFNGLGGNLNVYPNANGQIDALGANIAYVLANTKSQLFWCASVLAMGGGQFRSIQLG